MLDPSDPASLDPAEQSPKAVFRFLAAAVRCSLQALPCAPDTPEAYAERDIAVTAVAASLNPLGYAEIGYAADVAAANAHRVNVLGQLAFCRGDLAATDRLQLQAARFGRDSRGALNALLKLQSYRRRLTEREAAMAEAAGRLALDGLAQGMAELPPPPPMPPPVAPQAAASPPAEPPKILRPPAPLPPSMAHLADAPPPEGADAEGPDAPPGYAPWEPGCDTPMWYTVIDDNMTEEQHALRSIWLDANDYTIRRPLCAAAIRKHRGPPPGFIFELPSPDIMHVLLHDNSSNFCWADTWQPHPEQRASHPDPCSPPA